VQRNFVSFLVKLSRIINAMKESDPDIFEDNLLRGGPEVTEFRELVGKLRPKRYHLQLHDKIFFPNILCQYCRCICSILLNSEFS